MAARMYWAKTPKKELAKVIKEKFDAHRDWGRNTGYFDRIQRCYDTYNGTREKGTLHMEVEEKLTHVNLNNYKSLLQRLHILVTQTKFDIDVMTRNSDATSQTQADLGQGIINYYIEKGLGMVMSEAVLTSLTCLEAWIYAPWDVEGGGDVTRDEDGELVREGDQAYYVLTAFDVARAQQTEKSPWYVIRQKVNKWEAAARVTNEDMKQAILNSTIDFDEHDYFLDPTNRVADPLTRDDDTTYQYTFFHNKTSALPEGRQAVMIGGEIVADGDLMDDTGGYTSAPIFKLVAGRLLQTTLADSPATSLVALQQAINKISTAITTNAMNTSLNALWSQDPAMTIQESAGQLKMVISGTKPEVLDFSSPNEGAHRALDLYLSQQQLLSGVNDAARGDAGKSQSGTSLSLLLAVAIQHVQDLQKGYEKLASDVTTQTIQNTQRFLKVEKIAYIVGKTRKTYAQDYKVEDIKSISRVVAKIGNPATQSFEGRFEMAQTMIQHGALTDPRVILDFLRTGNLEAITEDEFGDSLNIRTENEAMLKGINPPTLMTDRHPEHIMKHRAVLADPANRRDPKITQAVSEHILGHYQQMKKMPPDLAAILGIPPLPSQQAPIGPAAGVPEGESAPGDISQQANAAIEQVNQQAANLSQPPQ